MLLSNGTGGLLQADVGDEVQVPDASTSSKGVSGRSLSTGATITACARTVFTVGRVDDNDGYGADTYVHYGQMFRLGSSMHLGTDRPYYVHASAADASSDASNGGTPFAEGESLACLYPRAAAGTRWRVVRAAEPTRGGRKATRGKGDGGTDTRVRLNAHLLLESVAHGESCRLSSDSTVRITSYGNEWRVFGGAAGPAALWSFVDMEWAETKVAEAKELTKQGLVKADTAQLLIDPVYRAENDLRVMDDDGVGAKAYAVLERVYPLLRGRGMHYVRRFRRTCELADPPSVGVMRMETFQGCASNMGLRFTKPELHQLSRLFAVGEEEGLVDYRHFFALMAPTMPKVRVEAVRDAYNKLEGLADGGCVEVSIIQGQWNPRCNPSVQQGIMTQFEAMQDFMVQWDVMSADGSVTFEEFLDYYRDVSTAVESDEAFLEIVRCGWGL
jgi:hypothetical protein